MAEERNVSTIEIINDVEEVTDVYDEIIDVLDTETYVIGSDHAFPAMGESNQQLQHPLLNGRELLDQHPITAITGLRDELDDIEALQTLYSNQKQQADYYLWYDQNPYQENRNGLFVTICDDIRSVRICEGADVFGVTVNEAAFIGNQNVVPRDQSYGLVIHSGIVAVRCELEVHIGDYVISNAYGYAQRSVNNYGYKVINTARLNGVYYAFIMIGVADEKTYNLSQDVDAIYARMGEAEKNITSAINAASAAQSKADQIGNAQQESSQQAEEANRQSSETSTLLQQYQINLEKAQTLATQANAIANAAVTNALALKTEAVGIANDAVADTKRLIKDLEPILEWEDEESGNKGASYYVQTMLDNLYTKASIETVDSLKDSALTSIQQNAKSLQFLAFAMDKYSVGEYSQAYGLTVDQAKSTLEVGMVYVPIGTKTEKYLKKKAETEGQNDEYDSQQFIKGYAYTWNGVRWVASNSMVVNFSAEYIESIGDAIYWYSTNTQTVMHDGVAYEPNTLYLWGEAIPEFYQDTSTDEWQLSVPKWVAVANSYQNVSGRQTSLIKQTANEILLSVSNLKGDFAGYKAEVANTYATTSSIATWGEKLAAVETKADANAASVGLVVATTDDGGNIIKASSIVTAINQSGDTSIALNADHILLEGIVTANNGFQITTNGYLIATGATITGDITATSLTLLDCQLQTSDINGLDNKFSTVNDAIDRTSAVATSAQSTATAASNDAITSLEYSEEAKNNMRRYTNLLINSGEPTNGYGIVMAPTVVDGSVSASRTGFFVENHATYGRTFLCQTKGYVDNTVATGEVYVYTARADVLPHTYYTISFDVRVSGDFKSMDVYFFGSSNADATGATYEDKYMHVIESQIKLGAKINSNEDTLQKDAWVRYVHTFRTSLSEVTGYIRIDNNGAASATQTTEASGNSKIRIRNIKLEQGRFNDVPTYYPSVLTSMSNGTVIMANPDGVIVDNYDPKMVITKNGDGTATITNTETHASYTASTQGLLMASNAFISGTIVASQGIFGGLLIGTDENGYGILKSSDNIICIHSIPAERPLFNLANIFTTLFGVPSGSEVLKVGSFSLNVNSSGSTTCVAPWLLSTSVISDWRIVVGDFPDHWTQIVHTNGQCYMHSSTYSYKFMCKDSSDKQRLVEFALDTSDSVYKIQVKVYTTDRDRYITGYLKLTDITTA